MKIFNNKRTLMMIFVCLIVILSTIILTTSKITTHATFSGQSSGMSRADLHTATLSTSVSTDTPTITVLMHGLGGRAKDWSNGMYLDESDWVVPSPNIFVYDYDSIIEKIRRTTLNGIKLYVARIRTISSDFSLYSEYTFDGDNTSSALEVTTITEFSQHTVVVFDLTSTWIALEQIYEMFHYALDKLSFDFYATMGCLPNLNLIGQSLGGLVNMNYAIEHPKNVSSLVSLGTPYNGSWADNFFARFLGIDDFEKQPCITGKCGNSFCNLTTRKNTWNSVYAQNPHINFHALSGTTSKTMLDFIISGNRYLETHLEISSIAADGIRATYALLFVPPYTNVGIGMTSESGILPGDVCVEESSQKAEGYDGVNTYNKHFTTSNSNVSKCSQNAFPVPHNLETYDADMHNYILNNVTFGAPFSTNNAGNTITGVNVTLSGFIMMPSVIKGITITSIGASAFANQTLLNEISIPSSVERIGLGAFEGCRNLRKMTVPFIGNSLNGTTNTHFGYIFGALEYTNHNVKVPSSLKTINITGGDRIANNAFAGCIRITSITIPNTVESIGMSAFDECIFLENIIVNANNPIYDSRNNCNAIIKTDTNELVVGCKNTIIPDSVEKIGTLSFQNCRYLFDLIIPDSVEEIEVNAFLGCSSLEITWEYNPELSVDNFKNWLTIVNVPTGVTSIDDEVFANCSKLTEITIPNTISSIGADVFKNCPNLKKINSLNMNSFGALDINSFELADNEDTIINMFNANDTSSIKAVNLLQAAELEIKVNGTNVILFVVRETQNNNVRVTEVLQSSAFSGYTGEINLKDGIYYIGYFSTEDIDVEIARKISKYGSQYMQTDMIMKGTEVDLNGGLPGENTITQGYTKLIYFSNTMGLPSSSRLDYYWYSENNNIATVSAYGTVFALPVSVDTQIKIMAVYIYDSSIVLIKDFIIKKEMRSSTADLIEIAIAINVKADVYTSIDLINLPSGVKVPSPILQYYNWNYNQAAHPNITVDTWGRIYAKDAAIENTSIVIGVYKYNPRWMLYIYVTVTG